MVNYLDKLKQLGSPEKDLSQVTIGVTVFDRPNHLHTFLQTVRKFYPDVTVRIADNGTFPVPAAVFDHLPNVIYHRLDADCGLSACRNFLLDACTTEYLLICEEDFEFTENTRIGSLLSVLEEDPEIALVGAPLVNETGERQEFSKSFDYFRGRLTTVDNRNAFKVTKDLVPFRYADMVFNFFLCRKEAFPEIRWDSSLKLAEHLDHMFRIYQQRRWRIAHAPTVSAIHNRSGRSDHYNEARIRARDWVKKWQGKHTYRDVSEFNKWYGNPNVIVYGVGHSGTSFLSQCFEKLGWNPLDADASYHESRTIRKLNNDFFRNGVFNSDVAFATLRLKDGWCVKDPRFVETLPLWLPVFERLHKAPTLVWIEKDIEEVRKSYEKRKEYVRGVAGVRDLTLEELYELAERNYNLYPHPKVRIKYEGLVRAIQEFVPPSSVSLRKEMPPMSGQASNSVEVPVEVVSAPAVTTLVISLSPELKAQLLAAVIANNNIQQHTPDKDDELLKEATLAFWRGQLSQYLQSQVNGQVLQAFSAVQAEVK